LGSYGKSAQADWNGLSRSSADFGYQPELDQGCHTLGSRLSRSALRAGWPIVGDAVLRALVIGEIAQQPRAEVALTGSWKVHKYYLCAFHALADDKKYFYALIALTLLFSAAAQAQDAGYELTGYVVASGATIDGGAYSVSGALGQPDTGTLSSGDYSLGGGFFGGGVIGGDRWRNDACLCANDAARIVRAMSPQCPLRRRRWR
jgi:hypothetical protein